MGRSAGSGGGCGGCGVGLDGWGGVAEQGGTRGVGAGCVQRECGGRSAEADQARGGGGLRRGDRVGWSGVEVKWDR